MIVLAKNNSGGTTERDQLICSLKIETSDVCIKQGKWNQHFSAINEWKKVVFESSKILKSVRNLSIHTYLNRWKMSQKWQAQLTQLRTINDFINQNIK